MTDKKYSEKRKKVKKLYDQLKPYIKAELVFKYLSSFYGVTIDKSRLSNILSGRGKKMPIKLDQIDSVLQFIKKTHEL